MQRLPKLGLFGVLALGVASCERRAAEHRGAEQAIVAQERSALEQWAAGNPLGYLDIDAADVTYFDDIGAHSRVDGIEAMRTYLSSLEGRIPRSRALVAGQGWRGRHRLTASEEDCRFGGMSQ